MRRTDLQRRVLAWASTLERPLPWRGERDPYRVLVSEVMLQQTQAVRVAPIYERFLGRFPTADALAEASPADVLRAWENLGYPRRALNLWRAARAVVERGGFPSTVHGLQELPGIGPYTARAVASFAFGGEVAAVDANVRRVVSRVSGCGVADVQDVGDGLVPRGQVEAWNQAMIDLGAVVCRARSPRCGSCPVSSLCAWHRGVRPQTLRRAKAPRFESTARYARGRVMQALRSRDGASETSLLRSTGLDRHRLRDAVESLVDDGLVHRERRSLRLGPSERGRADARRR